MGTTKLRANQIFGISTNYAPVLNNVLPVSSLPSTGTSVRLLGAYFNPNTTVLISGQTVNTVSFISDNELLVGLTTGNVEGTFAITINNGNSSVFTNRFIVSFGDVKVPTNNDWVITSGQVNTAINGEFKLAVKDSPAVGYLNTADFIIPDGVDFELRFNFLTSPIEANPDQGYTPNQGVTLINSSNADVYGFFVWDYPYANSNPALAQYIWREGTTIKGDLKNVALESVCSIKRVGAQTYYIVDGIIRYTSAFVSSGDLKIKAYISELSIINLKLIYI
ncbi:hypothetical protein SAMN04487764_1501 [Gillisia sp. Hel1_33_143]|uniref:IPT/TIG domain-containing protein n=1 Tax=Gillisia sp. Hel1_33_143 TaxID=1336796 RepID=UPI00087BEB5B|nr:IPT/TIG domain-containing protein [Gillisia sp. Hel1_33_143]SDS12012.1 hypothetical protein SAMN04487764_1501 [Gillisia sp. Hel1_33_143]